MSVIKRNIAANFGGAVWTGIMNLVFVPLYIHFLGIEAYGLVGIFATLLGLFGLLDMGLSITLNREMARLAASDESAQEMRDLLRTLEIPYWIGAVLFGVVVVLLAPFVAYHWVNVENLSPKTVQIAVMLMGLAIAFQWPISFYSGGLLGLERQVLLNIINVVLSTSRGLGAVLILWLVSPTAEAYFSWQIVASAVHVGLITLFLWRSLPKSSQPARFRRELLSNVWRFAASMTGIVATSTVISQLDKVILSRALSLETFGYYTLATVIAVSLYRFISPVFTATFPRLTSLVGLGATQELIALYHKSAQLLSVLVIPVALVVAFFSEELLLLWTQSAETASQTHVLVSILILGTAIHGLMHIPYALQLAYGWTRLTLTLNVVSVLFVVPGVILFTRWFGAVGAASVWLILNVGCIVASITLMHRRLLPTEKWRWCFEDVGRPLLAAVLVSATGRFIIRPDWPPMPLIASLALVSAVTLAATALAADQLDVFAKGKTFVGDWRARAIGRK